MNYEKAIDDLFKHAIDSYNNEDPDQYIKDSRQAMDLAVAANDSMRISKAYQYIGQFYIWNGNSLVAFEYYRRAMDISEVINDREGISKCLFSMGILSYSSNDFSEGNRLFSQVLPYLDKNSGRQYLTTLYLLGLCKTELAEYNQADSLLHLAMRAFEKNKDSSRLYECRSGLLQLHVRRNRQKEAEAWYVDLCKSENQYLNAVRPWIEYEMSYLYEQKGLYKLALKHAEMADQAKEGASVSLYMELKLNKLMSRLYEYTNNPVLAFKYYKRATANSDSLNSEEIAKRLESQKMSSEMRAKQTEINLLNSEVKVNILAKRIYLIVISSLGLFLVFMVVFMITRNRLNKQLKVRNSQLGEAMKKSDDLLLNILPEEVADELKENGKSAARFYDSVTVLFTDFVNFTGISQQLTPAELVEEIHYNFTAFDAIMDKHGLEKIKTIGDAYMAVCGLPVADPDHALKMTAAALEIREWMKHENGRFQIRIGLHSGPVVAGIVGTRKYAYDIWGDTVNTAARMEQNSEPGKINISEATYELIKDKYDCTFRGMIKAKNKGEMGMYFIV